MVGIRARVQQFRHIRDLRISGRPARITAALAGACGQAASHPRIGGTGVPSPGLFRTNMALVQPVREHFRPRRSTGQYCSLTAEKLVLGSAPLASHSLETGVDDIAHYQLPQPLARAKRRHPDSGIARHARHETQLKAFHRERVEHCVPLLRPTADHYHEGDCGHEDIRIQNNHRCCGARAGCGRDSALVGQETVARDVGRRRHQPGEAVTPSLASP